MDTIIFATNNAHKVEEMRAALGNLFHILPLKEAGINIDIPEPHDTLEANATEKSQTIHRLTGQDCFSEDTGLETEALNGEPGVKSARYADNDPDFTSNIDKLLHRMKGQVNRKARFRTVISLIIKNKEYIFEGICNGQITTAPVGTGGFGYDPVFIPDGSDQTFAEMNLIGKNRFSHRKKALQKMVQYLRDQEY